MSFVFYDTETTDTNTTFDQILQFAAILTVSCSEKWAPELSSSGSTVSPMLSCLGNSR